MGRKLVEDMTYKEVLYGVRRQLENINTTVNNLDQREIQLQKMVERLQGEITHKTNETELVELKGRVNTLEATVKGQLEVINKQEETEHKTKREGKDDWKWVAVILFNLGIFVVGLLINHWPK